MGWDMGWRWSRAVVLVLTTGCYDSFEMGAGIDSGDESEVETPFEQTAGFITVPAREVAANLGIRWGGTASESRIFYALIPADTDAVDMPLLVIYNGGPGAATTSGLFMYGMGPYWIDYLSGDLSLKENPNSFTAIGNLLFLDLADAGFSYGVIPHPESALDRAAEDNFYNFGMLTDAANTLLAVLGVMAKIPALRDNPVVFVGESWGGARTAAVSELLSHPATLSDPAALFYDPVLQDALKAHFREVMPEQSFAALTRKETAAQFGWQVLLQPGHILEADYMWGGVCTNYLKRDDPRIPLCEAGNGGHDIRYENAYDGLHGAAVHYFLNPDDFETLFGVPPRSIEGLPASERSGAFRFDFLEDPAANPSSWNEEMGILPPYDDYHVQFGGVESYPNVNDAQIATLPFIQSLMHVHTFVSIAYYDGVVDSLRLGFSLAVSADHLPVPLIEDLDFDDATRDGVARPGWMTVEFTEAAGLGEDAIRTIRMPTYFDSGHMIPLTEAGPLREDVRQFLSERGAYR